MSSLLLAATNVQAKNPILPDAKEIIWTVIAFAIVFAILAKFAFPAVKRGIAAREERIRADLERAERARAESEAAELRNRAQEDSRLASERAFTELRSEVATLSVELAEKIVQRNLDRDTQLGLIEQYIRSVGNGNGARRGR